MNACAGVDGCKGGWIAVIRHPDSAPEALVVATFVELVDLLPAEALIAVDMPIGLPEQTNAGGRGPEALVRRKLGERQSSVFSISARAAVYAETGSFASAQDWYAAHQRASMVARATSQPPRGVSIQAFGIFPKIREIDALLIQRPDLRHRVFEAHPEVAFWRLNAGSAMRLPKKIRGSVNPAGMDERRALLANCGLPRAFLGQTPPRGAADDDYLDACAMLLVAERRMRGEAVPVPDPPAMDGEGIPIAIWS